MHTLAVQIAPVIAAEKSKVPFYIAGGLLVLWALTVSLGLGLRNPNFPGSLGGQRAVSAITAVLVIAAASTAVSPAGIGFRVPQPPKPEPQPEPTSKAIATTEREANVERMRPPKTVE